ncbi:MAG: DUF1501 domain-containing protein [Myxococcota bacterium]|nr:DUF1501 domain-containing protein [Myxococcota bacterium]MEC8423508.1 DUF1501 domain-containing protein [Myxococcota bacterium]
MNRRELLIRGAAAGVAGMLAPRLAHASGGDCLIVYVANGGWDPTFVFDPHLDSATVQGPPDSTLATAGGITFADAASRPAVRSFFEQHGARSCVVNGIAVGSISHPKCMRLMMTGSRRTDFADVATRVGAAAGAGLALPALVVSGPRYPGALGASTTPLSRTLLGTVDGSLPADAGFDPGVESRIRGFLAEEAGFMAADEPSVLVDQYVEGLSRYDDLEAGIAQLRLQAYAQWREQAEAGVAALSGGLSRAVVIEGTVPLLSQWDSHASNDDLQDRNFEHMFGELSQLLQMLGRAAAPEGGRLDERTTLLVLSEMGRTPVQNSVGGKDHWPYTSAMLVGAGIAGGRVVGATDDTLTGMAVDPMTGAASTTGTLVTPASLAAGLLERFGIDATEAFPDAAPFRAPFA